MSNLEKNPNISDKPSVCDRIVAALTALTLVASGTVLVRSIKNDIDWRNALSDSCSAVVVDSGTGQTCSSGSGLGICVPYYWGRFETIDCFQEDEGRFCDPSSFRLTSSKPFKTGQTLTFDKATGEWS